MHQVLSATPLLFVARIEDSLPFFEAIGFHKTMDVPHGDSIGFCMLAHEGINLMLQSFDSLADDMPQIGSAARGPSFLYIKVKDLDASCRDLAAYPQFLPRRKTFYGAEEVGLIEPGGHYLTLAQFDEH